MYVKSLASLVIGIAVASVATLGSAEELPPGLTVTAIEAAPQSLELSHKFDYRQLLITGVLDNGQRVDLTRMAKLAQPARVATVSDHGLVRPAADGQEQLVFTFGEHSTPVMVKVTGAETPRATSFVQDVQPAFSKMGCNSGTCHGSKDGKNGFKLSLRGYDPLFDHRAFTDDHGARRINRVAPDQSLMLLKASGSIPHEGGVRTRPGEPFYELLRQWIASGARLDLDAPRVTSIEVFPQNPIVPRAGMKQQMQVVATYADGVTRDVTNEAFVESGDIELLEADAQGLITTLRRGEAPVLVRYEGAYAATTITVMGDRSEFVWSNPPTYNYLDEHVYDKLQRVKILPSDVCTDEEFVRRVYLDLTGLPPTVEQVREFLADERPSRAKRDALVDRLVGNPEFIEYWTNKWADLLQVNRKFLGEEGSITLRNWIKQQVATNAPYDEFARQVLTASGSNLENPPASYYKTLRDPDVLMENTTHLFLAIRFNCNKCHDHPFERWTQDQYYHLAAYFAQVGLKEDQAFSGQKIGGSAVEGAKPLVEVVYDKGSGEVTHDRTGEVAPPAFPYTHADEPPADASRRDQLAHWITSPENPYFAKSYVNRLWGYLFGRGIIEPIDDIRAGNPPTNPELLDALTQDFINSGFDVQHMFRTICKSRTYQHSIQTNEWNEDDTINYSHCIPRRLPAETLFDAIHLAAGATPNLPGAPKGFRAAQLPDAGVPIPFLDDFGRPTRESSCECERSDGIVLGPVMKLINGPTVADAIHNPNGELTKLVAAESDDAKLIEEVFLRFIARKPTETELQLGLEAMQAAGEGHDELVAALKAYEEQLPAKQTEWEKHAAREVEWVPLDATEKRSQVEAQFEKKEDGSIFVSGPNGKDVYTIVANSDLSGITGVRLEALADPALPAGGPGRAQNGNFVLNELKLTAAAPNDPRGAQAVELVNATADFSQSGWDVRGAVDGNEASGWAVSPESNKTHTAVFETKEAIGAEGGSVLTFTFSQQYQDSKHTLGRFRLSVTNSPKPFTMSRLPAELAAILKTPADPRTPEQQQKLSEHYRSTDSELARLEAEVKKSEELLKNRRLVGVQDLAWALINNPAFLFNR
ncbi:MAG: DUF1553 domain-containing protein [Planctomycetes bacterium]|nr:DUF1553 domain-containing protein [Planctomycetota bacterium]